MEKEISEEEFMRNLWNAEMVVNKFNDFWVAYDFFRKYNGLNKAIDNSYEILAAMADKLGRMCRQIKHFERNDPKEDWPDVLGEDGSGLIVYLLMAFNKYDIDLSKSFKAELIKAIEKH